MKQNEQPFVLHEVTAAEIGVAIDRVLAEVERTAIGHRRYETVRKLNPRQFREIWDRNLRGERFDDIIDQITKDAQTSPSP